MVDDSHATGFIGAKGRGSADHFGVMDKIDIFTSTLGKAIGGASGGFTTGKKEIIDLLRQKSRPYLFSNSIAPSVASAAIEAFKIIEEDNKFKNKVIIDPGIGFGKTLKHNLTLISKISLFHSLGFPILVGTSRKKFINQISGKYDSKDRIGGTVASILFLLSQGVQIFRVHNVIDVKQGILVFDKIINN